MQEWIQARSPKAAEVQVQICQEPPKLLLARALGSAHSKAHSDPEFNAVVVRKHFSQLNLSMQLACDQINDKLFCFCLIGF